MQNGLADTSQPWSAPTPRGFWGWITVFGPGAIIASLTIGTGELIFSTRAGTLFGYRVLFLFVVICLLKWALVLASARHMVFTGVHPYQRMMELPGPRGWLPLLLFLVAAVCIPIWVSFHSGVLGNFTAWMTGTQGILHGGVDYLWGAGLLALVLAISATGGYSTLERIQLAIVAAMLGCAFLTLLLYRPDWWELVRGAAVPQALEYPSWLGAKYPEIARQPVWLEWTRYVGVIGGGAFDYMAYTSFLRDKGWGQAGQGPASAQRLAEIAGQPDHPARQWLRAPLVDCSLSFLVVLAFSGVFVAAGALVLGPRQQVPNEENLLSLQAAFVTGVHPWLWPLYCAGAFLAMFGTLYGTLEVAGSVAVEMANCLRPDGATRHAPRIKRTAIIWCAVVAYAILLWLCHYQLTGAAGKPRLLLAILTPANVLTGVLGCGLLCALNLWMDRRYLPQGLRFPWWLWLANLVAACALIAVGLYTCWGSASRWYALAGLTLLVLTSLVGAAVSGKKPRNPRV